MKTILIYPPNEEQLNNLAEVSRTGLTLGIAYISAYLNKHGYVTDIINAPYQGLSVQDLITLLSSENYQAVGISMSIQEDVPDTIRLADAIRSEFPNMYIYVGGHFATHESKNILENVKSIDCVVRGEGEKTTLKLIKALEKNEDLRNINGLSYRVGNEIVENSPADLIDNLDELPSPINELAKISRIDEVVTNISSQRGCYSNCSFCSIAAFYGKRVIRKRSPENVVDEIEQYYTQYNRRVFRFLDDDFVDRSVNGRKWMEGFCQEIKKRNLSIQFDIQVRANECVPEVLKPLIEVGLYGVAIGLESFSDEMLKRMNKHITMEQIKSSIRVTRDLGIKLRPYYIMFEPDMTFEDLCKNYTFLKMYGFFGPYQIYNYARPYSGTPLRSKLVQENRLIMENWYDVGKYEFIDSNVQKTYKDLMLTNKALLKAEAANRNSRRKYEKTLNSYMNLSYEDRRKTIDLFLEMYKIDHRILDLMTATSIKTLGKILKSIKQNQDYIDIEKDNQIALSQINDMEIEIGVAENKIFSLIGYDAQKAE